jgi:hypothetical protein
MLPGGALAHAVHGHDHPLMLVHWHLAEGQTVLGLPALGVGACLVLAALIAGAGAFVSRRFKGAPRSSWAFGATAVSLAVLGFGLIAGLF